MNLHVPQDIESDVELLSLAAVPYQIISPGNNSSIIGIYQDSMLGAYQFTRPDISFTQQNAMNLLMSFSKIDTTLFKKKNIRNFDILSQILPSMTMQNRNKKYSDDEDYSKSNNIIDIVNGQYMRGQIDKGILGSTTKGLIHRICNDFGNMAASNFIDDFQPGTIRQLDGG